MSEGLPTALSSYLRDIDLLLANFYTQVLLFGSRAIGTARLDSDYDLAIFVCKDAPIGDLQRKASDAAFPYIIEGFEIRPVVLRNELLESDSQFARHLRQVGVRVG